VAARLPLEAGDHVLDIGCGPGWFWATAAPQLPPKLDLTLSDQSAGMVAEAVQRCTPLPLAAVRGQQADAASLPFAEGSFAAVVAMHMLYHVPDQAQAIAEMHRVLRPGGCLAVTTNGVGNMQKLYALTTVFGSPPYDPAAAAFGYGDAERLLSAQFGNVSTAHHPARLRVTEPEDVFLALTSYPPGDAASEAQLVVLRAAIDRAFEEGGGVLETDKETALFLARKAS
jgi:SAM-dependent methyltransferase